MKRAIFNVAVMFALTMATVPVRAADAASDTHLAAALDYLDATNAKAKTAAAIEALIPALVAEALRQSPNLNDVVMREYQATVLEEMTASLDELMKADALAYERHYSEDELRRLTEFYRSDLGRKYTATEPTVLQETIPLGRAWGEETSVRAMRRALERLRANRVIP